MLLDADAALVEKIVAAHVAAMSPVPPWDLEYQRASVALSRFPHSTSIRQHLGLLLEMRGDEESALDMQAAAAESTTAEWAAMMRAPACPEWASVYWPALTVEHARSRWGASVVPLNNGTDHGTGPLLTVALPDASLHAAGPNHGSAVVVAGCAVHFLNGAKDTPGSLQPHGPVPRHVVELDDAVFIPIDEDAGSALFDALPKLVLLRASLEADHSDALPTGAQPKCRRKVILPRSSAALSVVRRLEFPESCIAWYTGGDQVYRVAALTLMLTLHDPAHDKSSPGTTAALLPPALLATARQVGCMIPG